MATIRKPATVAEYIAAAAPEAKSKLREMRALIAAAAPGATQSLKWSMPSFSYGRILVTFAAFKRHIGFFPTPSAVRAFASQLDRYKHASGSIQFPLDKPLPKALITRITKFRVKELRELDRKWMERRR